MVEQGLGDWRSTMVEQISLAINTAMAETSQRLEACIARFCEQEEVLMKTLKDDQLRYQKEVRSSLSPIMSHDTTTEFSAQRVFDVIPDRNSVFSDGFLHFGGDNGFGYDGFLSDEIKFINVVEKPVFASLDYENSGVEESVVSTPFVTNPNEKNCEDVGKLDKGDKGTMMETVFSESKNVGGQVKMIGYDELRKRIGLGGPAKMGLVFGVGYMASGSGGGPGGSYGGHGGIGDEKKVDANEGMTLKVQEIDTYVFQRKYSLDYEQQIDPGQIQKIAEECWNGGGDGIVTATSMSLGDTCIRGCRFGANEFYDNDMRNSYRSIIPIRPSEDFILKELYKMMTMQTRVYVVHMSHSLAARFFLKARELGMMSEGYAWIVSSAIMNMISSLDSHFVQSIQVLWINLREEPVVYINGRPFVLRDVERPFSNLEYTGINRSRLEQMEDRLREDILHEASRYGNKILVTDELPDGQMVDQWEPVTQESVTTPLEVYLDLQNRSYIVDYDRVPITDEKSPKEQDFDILVQRILQADIETKIIFNCQMGRGRTTTGMVIATLIYLNRIGSSVIWRTSSRGTISDCASSVAASSVADKLPNSEEVVSRGEYTVIRSLIRVLEGGIEGKRLVDKVIDKCSSMQNLREVISTYRNSVLRQSDEMKRAALLSFFVEYLERYYYLICFSVYLYTERVALDSGSSSHCSFYELMKSRPELYTIIQRLLRRDPMGALGYARTKPSLLKIPESAKIHPSDMETIACLRKGEVLGNQTVLKSDHCPGCQRPSLPERVEGAPNFREIPGFPVYVVAKPTIDGILFVIRRIGSSKGGRQVFWPNMREEPVIYINGKPFVLREVERPYKNMLEYRGIDRHRVEGMEARLKDDILREAERYHGAIIVIHENDDGQIFDGWEHVSPEVVKTPLEVFRGLQADGFPVKYARVPITDGKAPRSSDFDTRAINRASSCKNTALVFNCQMGCGRTTGTVIACLLKLRIDYGRPIKMLLDEFSHKEANSDLSSGEEADDHCQESLSTLVKGRTEKEASHNFGINDILLWWKITTLFENGVNCREALDAVIDRCSALQNIRQAVLQYRKVFNQQQDEPRKRRVALNRGAEYLERYFRLIAFAAYLGSLEKGGVGALELVTYMGGMKLVVIISEAGSAGMSLQADRRAIIQRRVHVTTVVQQFPCFHLEDKVSLWARGNVMTPHKCNDLVKYSRQKHKGQKVISLLQVNKNGQGTKG